MSLTTHILTPCQRLTTGTHYDDRSGWRFKCPACERVTRVSPTFALMHTIVCDGIRFSKLPTGRQSDGNGESGRRPVQ